MFIKNSLYNVNFKRSAMAPFIMGSHFDKMERFHIFAYRKQLTI
jgi:hypothetical protein